MPLVFVHEGDYLSANIHDQFKRFFARHCAVETEAILCELDVSRHYSVTVHMLDLVSHNMVRGE
ncbi:hypothetical protein T492DRAFT_1088619 [Pavlovales sp. CCMP2436]|nr:hypothetical protein T492DRAFT_1088619 [Pavlovales sp. CCMP2436]